MGSKFKVAIPVILVALISAMSLVFATTVPEWGSYHRTELRAGANEDQNPNAAKIRLIWTFPRYDLVVGSAVVDIPAGSGWSTDGSTQWNDSTDTSPKDGYEDGIAAGATPRFKWTNATDTLTNARWAKWNFPSSKLEKGEYTVQVYFPSSRTTPGDDPNTKVAPYTVYWINKTGDVIANTVRVNQEKGGSWVNLGNLSFDIDPSRTGTATLQDGREITIYGACVVLSNVVDKSDLRDASNNPDPKIVCADAVRWLPGTAMEFYSSPAAGKAAIDVKGRTGEIPAVWIGTTEGGLASGAEGVKDFGAMYCVRSYFGADFTPSDGSGGWNSDEALNVGTAAWRYPRGGSFDDPSRKAADRDPLEGPIGRIGLEGGIFSSPTLVPMPTTLAPSGFGVVFGAMDGQVYCLDSESGKLIWKGPGVTMSETQVKDLGDTMPSKWTAVTNRQDAFGGSFYQALVTDTDSPSQYITYDITKTTSDPANDAGKTSKSGHFYAIYAWIPTVTDATPRTRDAAYQISYVDVSGTTPKAETKWIRIDQSDIRSSTNNDPSPGRWVKLGDKFWNPSKVELSTQSRIAHPDPDDPKKTIDTYVVADAIMVVPVEISSFKYSTPIADKAGRIFAANTNGRVYCLEAPKVPNADCSASLNWTFPKVQTKAPSSGTDDDAASPMGAIVASPTLYKDNLLLVPSLDGKVYALKDLDGSEAVTTNDTRLKWTFTASAGDVVGTFEAFSSSASVKDDIAYLCSTGGHVYSIKLDTAPATGTDMQAQWSWPDKSANDMPKAPYRYSTAATIKRSTDDLYCATTGGTVYNLNPSNTTDKVAPDFMEDGASFYSPIQSSVALDENTLFVGTMGTGDGDDAGFYWVNRDVGAPATQEENIGYTGVGSVFSSPALANDYIYVGVGKGRLCAFSDTAFGGNWVGGGKEGWANPPFIEQTAVDPSLSEVSPHLDVFDGTRWDKTLEWANSHLSDLNTVDVRGIATSAIFTDGRVYTEADSDWQTNSHARAYGVGTASPREVYYEWGETIYLIAWNLPPMDEISGGGGDAGSPVGSAGKRNSVKFNFTNASGGVGSGSTIPPKNADYLFEYAYKAKDGTMVKRCFAMAKYTIDGSTTRPPAPGPNWNISLTVLRASTNGTQSATPVAVVPLLTGGNGSWKVSWKTSKKSTVKQWKEQPIGCNNPIGLAADPTDKNQWIAWPTTQSGGLYLANCTDPTYQREKHFNGNAYSIGNKYYTKNIALYLGYGRHGASTPQVNCNVMDLSAMGLLMDNNNQPKSIDKFRIQLGDLRWNGGNGAVINPMPWEQMPWTNYGAYVSRTQRDYPNINSSQAQFQKISDNSDPSAGKVTLEHAIPGGTMAYIDAKLVPDPVNSSVNVPLYQPANNTTGGGYGTSVLAYVDSDDNGHFDGGDSYQGSPNTYAETYRKYSLNMDVPPDYHLVVDNPLSIDISGPDGSAAPHGLGIGLDPLTLKDWYREFSAKNLGNVNLPNIKIAKYINGASNPVSLFSDYVGGDHYIDSKTLGTGQSGIVSTLDGIFDPNITPNDLIHPVGGEPYATIIGTPEVPYPTNLTAEYTNPNLGYVISKPRVGDVDPTELTVPDERKLKWMVGAGFASPSIKPQKPSISVRVPLTQPTGTYHTMVPLFSDLNHDNTLNLGSEAFADPTFRLNISVAEDRITGGATPGSAIQIDPGTDPAYGDVQPTAWRDISDGNVYMFWSSNRYITGAPAATSPWYIGYKALVYNTPASGGPGELDWRINTASGVKPFWWCDLTGSPTNHLPASAWPTLTTEYNEDSVKHSAPFAAMGEFEGNKVRDVMLFWQGQIDKKVNGKLERQYKLFYTPATGGVVTSPGNIYSFANDPAMVKLAPKAAYLKSYNDKVPDKMWLFYGGGAAGKMNLFVNYNESPRDNHKPENWSQDIKLQTPSSLASVADPMPLGRHISAGPGNIIDVGYTGTSRYDQTPDILWTRYRWSGGVSDPKMDFTIFPRVNDEELQKDPKLDVFTSQHLAWLRPGTAGNGSPYIVVRIPAATPLVITATGGTYQVDKATGIYTYSFTPGGDADTYLGQMLVDYSGGVVRFTKSLPPKTRVIASYTPQTMRLVRASEADTSPYMFIEGASASKGRLWVFWRKTKSSTQSSTAIYYKTYRMVVQGFGPALYDPATNETYNLQSIKEGEDPVDFRTADGKIYLPSSKERYKDFDGNGNQPFYPTVPNLKLELTYKSDSGATIPKIADTVTWQEELPATALPTRQSVNDGQICAFADPSVSDTKIWIFWANTRSGESDIYYQTLSPNFQVIR